MEEHPEARQIVETINKAGFIAYYAGGWVRDYLLKHPSDDIDIATNAPPETIQALFPHTVPVGIAFGIVIVIINSRQYEVATFRQDLDYHDGRRPSKIEFTTAVEDAKRRDFTINGMFYDPINEHIYDYVHGKADLEAKIIRAIGNPHARIKEDRLRMMRAVRLSCRFGFTIEEETAAAIRAHAKELFPAVAIERIVQELEKSKLYPTLIKLNEFGLLTTIFPDAQITPELKRIESYPKDTPLIASLLPLFPNYTLAQQLELAKFLKLPNHASDFLHHLAKYPAPDLHGWAHLYASPYSHIATHIKPDPEHANRKQHLAPYIRRIQEKTPLITSHILLSRGIKPGPEMGKLLLRAEQISINENLNDPDAVLKKL